MEQHLIKVFGERNTGTRAVSRMLASLPNVRRRIGPRPGALGDGSVEAAIETHMRGAWRRHYLHALRDEAAAQECVDDQWKHSVPTLTPAMIAADVKTLFMVRNPYSWFLALARRPYHLKGPAAPGLTEFALRPWMTERRENMPAIVKSPMVLWQSKVASYIDYEQCAGKSNLSCRFIRFEDFVQNGGGALSAALHAMGVGPFDITPIPQNTKPDGRTPSELAEYYRAEGWRDRLTRELVALINVQVDWGIAGRFHFRQLDPADFPERLDPEFSEQIRREMSGLRVILDRKAGAASAA